MLWGSETWPVKEEHLIRLGRNDAIWSGGQGTGFLLWNLVDCDTTKKYLQNRRLPWFSHLDSLWPNKCRKFGIGGSLAKTYIQVIRKDQEEWKVSKETN